MSQMCNCRYCAHKFKHKYAYQDWQHIRKELHRRAVKAMAPIASIDFLFDKRLWYIESNCDKLHELCGELAIPLVEGLTEKQARKVTIWDYRWDKENWFVARNLKMLQQVSNSDANLYLDISLVDITQSGLEHHCGIVRIVGSTNVTIQLEEAWSCKI